MTSDNAIKDGSGKPADRTRARVQAVEDLVEVGTEAVRNRLASVEGRVRMRAGWRTLGMTKTSVVKE